MKRHILYLAMLALGTAATGCSDDDTAKEGRTEPTTVESISIRTQMAEVSRAQTGDDDPTMGPASTRAHDDGDARQRQRTHAGHV